MKFWQKYSAVRRYCYIQHPNPNVVEGRSAGGGKATLQADSPCIREPEHEGLHRDAFGREWNAPEPDDT